MTHNSSGRLAMIDSLLNASHTHTLEQLPGLVADSAARAGLHNTAIYLADLQQDTLHLLTGVGLDAGQTTGDEQERAVLPIEDTDGGRAYQYVVHPVQAPPADGGRQRWWVPLLDGTERVGVLGAGLDTGGPQETEDLERLAQLVTLLVVSKRGQSESYARLVRTRQMNLAAEMQWHMLPPLSFTTMVSPSAR